jgi:uncharacterized protein (TIGR02996 family)
MGTLETKKSLFNAVVASIADNAPRLIYADHLIENDDPRGEFIILQCKNGKKLKPKEASIAKVREEELLAAHREEWFGPLEKWIRQRDYYSLGQVKIARGFVTHCRLTARELDDLAVLFQKAPLLESLDLRGAAITPISQLAQLEKLNVAGACAQSILSAITSHFLPRLTSLTIEISSEALDFSNLRHLTHLSVNQLLSANVQLPASLVTVEWKANDRIPAKAIQQLHSLESLSITSMGPQEIAMLESLAPRLKHLGLNGVQFQKDAFATFVGIPWPKLESLDLSSVALGVEGARLLSKLKAPHLAAVDLRYTRIKDEGALAILNSPLGNQLTTLSLRSNNLTDAAMKPVVNSARKQWFNLLNLKKNKVSPAVEKQLQKKYPKTRFSR